MKNLKILVIEDDSLNLDLITTLLSGYGEISTAKNFEEGQDLLSFNKFDLAFIDLELNGKQSGFKLAKLSKDKNIYTVILSGQKDQDSIKKGFEKSNCDNYLFKPANLSMIKEVISHFDNQSTFHNIDTKIKNKLRTNNPKLNDVLEIVKNIYSGNSPIYIFGETGTGKQVLSELIHELKFGTLSNFHHLNCSAISDTMIESELFGHMKGAFTGAESRKIGLLEKADGGTLFLDEIATMSPLMQNKIITAIETKRFKPVGSNQEIISSFRLIAATSSVLTDDIQQGKFRQDLFFRINGVHLTMPPLRDRKDDLNNLIEAIAQNHISQKALYVSDDVYKKLNNYDWPGNIRELKNLITLWLDQSITKPTLKDIPLNIINNENIFTKNKFKYLTKKQLIQIKEMGLREFIKELEMEAIDASFNENKKKIKTTAKALKIHTDKVYSYLNRNNGEQYELLQ